MAGELYGIAITFMAEFKPDWRIEKDKRMYAATFPLAREDNMNLMQRIFVMEEYFVLESVHRKDFFMWLIFQSRQRAGPVR